MKRPSGDQRAMNGKRSVDTTLPPAAEPGPAADVRDLKNRQLVAGLIYQCQPLGVRREGDTGQLVPERPVWDRDRLAIAEVAVVAAVQPKRRRVAIAIGADPNRDQRAVPANRNGDRLPRAVHDLNHLWTRRAC